ncbi:50S ribosome-binding GTPase [Massilia pinisoli]|uniref:50S ribosome-binding GTPase n=1 Tax=Massilia pinisoli TaxID=1772194 RepID=A0ABT1ZM67_9BURK|nr:GTPase [Massilia pinisoli]MCS0581007.1 50S ribosome-binding GTPase [Massilia pinisoli]
MWWLAVPAIVGLGKLLYNTVTDGPPPQPTPPPDTTLIKNLRALRELTQKPDPRRVAFLGQPGAGKSTIVNKLSRGRARPAPVIGAHTDATNWAERTGIDLLCQWGKRSAADVPGYDTNSHPVSAFVLHFPFDNFGKICLVVHGKIHGADIKIYQAIRMHDVTPIVVRSHAESLDEEQRKTTRMDLCHHFVGLAPSSIVFVSSRTGEGLDELRLRL